jgi:translation initiation factor 1
MKQKKQSFNDLSALKNLLKEEYPDYVPDEAVSEEKINTRQNLEAHYSKKGRGGKIVTVIKGYEGSEESLKILGKEIKNKLGVGGSVKNGEIIIQGNIRDKIIKILQEKGFSVKKVGG